MKRPSLGLVVLAALAGCGITPPEQSVKAPGGPARLVVTETSAGAFEGADAYVEVRRNGNLIPRVRAGPGPNHLANIDLPAGRYAVAGWLRVCPSTGCLNEKDHLSHAPRTAECRQEVDADAGATRSVTFSSGCSNSSK